MQITVAYSSPVKKYYLQVEVAEAATASDGINKSGILKLDPEALNSAMNTLIDLQSTGRLVGIISHVPELEERIDARLKVSPAEKGSRAEFEIVE